MRPGGSSGECASSLERLNADSCGILLTWICSRGSTAIPVLAREFLVYELCVTELVNIASLQDYASTLDFELTTGTSFVDFFFLDGAGGPCANLIGLPRGMKP